MDNIYIFLKNSHWSYLKRNALPFPITSKARKTHASKLRDDCQQRAPKFPWSGHPTCLFKNIDLSDSVAVSGSTLDFFLFFFFWTAAFFILISFCLRMGNKRFTSIRFALFIAQRFWMLSSDWSECVDSSFITARPVICVVTVQSEGLVWWMSYIIYS